MVVQSHREDAPTRLGYGVLTVSSSRGPEEDRSGDRIAALVREADQLFVERVITPDDVVAIRGALKVLLGRDEVDVVVVNGGSGLAPQDVTPEAVTPMIERSLVGFGELFRMLSYEQVGPAAMLSRAVGGVARGKAVFVLPGSPDAVELAMKKLILPEAGHLLGQARRRR